MLRTAFIGLGSNLDSPIQQIKTAIETLSLHQELEVLKSSSLYESLPQGPQDQNRFILFIDQLILKQTNPNLTIPHPHALSRDFVLIPILEIDPNWQLPDQTLLQDHLSSSIKHELKKLTTIPVTV